MRSLSRSNCSPVSLRLAHLVIRTNGTTNCELAIAGCGMLRWVPECLPLCAKPSCPISLNLQRVFHAGEYDGSIALRNPALFWIMNSRGGDCWETRLP